MASLVETLDGRERFSTIPQLLVWIVFKDDNIILAAYFSQLFPTFKRESLASWVLEGGNDIYKFGMQLLYFLFYIFEMFQARCVGVECASSHHGVHGGSHRAF